MNAESKKRKSYITTLLQIRKEFSHYYDNTATRTIVISKLPVSSWYDLFKDNTYADASMDRLIHKAYRIEMNGKNMRNPGQ